jgi:hypothetical protein
MGLTEELIQQLYELIHLQSIQLQERIIRGTNEV